MKYIILLFLFLTACCDDAPRGGTSYPYGVHKFQDGNVTCYTFYDKGISCLKEGRQ